MYYIKRFGELAWELWPIQLYENVIHSIELYFQWHHPYELKFSISLFFRCRGWNGKMALKATYSIHLH